MQPKIKSNIIYRQGIIQRGMTEGISKRLNVVAWQKEGVLERRELTVKGGKRQTKLRFFAVKGFRGEWCGGGANFEV